MAENYSANIAPLFDAAKKNFLILEGATNDIAIGTAPATVYSSITSYVSQAHATGYKIAVWTMLSRSGFDTQKNTLNALIKANAAGADAIVDFSGTLLGCDGCFSNGTYFNPDGLHPTTFGVNAVEVPTISIVISALQ